jgi:signal transduction histidine kinase
MNEALLVYFNISFAIGALVSILSGIYILLQDKNNSVNQFWSGVTLFGSLWGLSYFAMINTSSRELALMANRVIHILAIGTIISYFLFCVYLTNQYQKYKTLFYTIAYAGLLLAVLVNFDFLLDGVRRGGVFNFIPVGGEWFIIFSLYLLSVASAGLHVLRKYKHKTDNKLEKKQINYVFIFSSLGWIGGASVLPLTHGLEILPYPILIWALYPFFATYAIVKLNLFNTKTVTAQIITAFLWVFLTVRLILSNSTADFIINGVVLALIIPAGILLIKGITKEIKERERAQELTKELKHMNEQKSKMLSIASHQFRSPLTSIQGYASLIKDGSYGEVPDDLREPIDRIVTSSKKLSRIVNDFLNISRIEDGRMNYNFKVTDVKDVVKEVIKEAESTAQAKDLDLSFETDTHSSYPAKIDIGKFQQVITNLVDNAIKYTEAGSVAVRLDRKNDYNLIEVEDTGIGIDPEDADIIFKQFSRADEAEDVNVVGSGLGLYIAKRIIEAHDGEISATSPGKGEGSTFHVKIRVSDS